MTFLKDYWSFLLIFIIYFVGLLGILSPYSDQVLKLSFYQLLFCTVLVLVRDLNAGLLWRFSLVALLAFGVEVIGVKTGLVFGDYSYANNLGWKLFSVPIIIALNWAILVYSAKILFNYFFKNNFLLAFFTASYLTALDFFIEKLAPSMGFWFWYESEPPLLNFIAWFLLSFIFSFIYRRGRDNSLAVFNLALMSLFFVILYFNSSF